MAGLEADALTHDNGASVKLEEAIDLFTPDGATATDTQSLMRLAGWYHVVSYEHHRGRTPSDAETPGSSITANQLEWAAREIESLRGALNAR